MTMKFYNVNERKPMEGQVVLCHFKVQWNHVFYVATYFEEFGFVPQKGFYAKPDEWSEIEGYSE